MTFMTNLTKKVFATHVVNEEGLAALLKPKVAREQFLSLISQLQQ